MIARKPRTAVGVQRRPFYATRRSGCVGTITRTGLIATLVVAALASCRPDQTSDAASAKNREPAESRNVEPALTARNATAASTQAEAPTAAASSQSEGLKAASTGVATPEPDVAAAAALSHETDPPAGGRDSHRATADVTRPDGPPNVAAVGAPALRPKVRIFFESDDPVDQAMRALIARWEQIRSVKATMHKVMEQKLGLPQKRRGEGLYELLKKDGKTMIRMVIFDSIVATRGEFDQVMTGERMTTVFNGEDLYVLQQLHKGQWAYKMPPRGLGGLLLGGPRLLATIRAGAEVTVDSEAKWNGRKAYLFKSSRRDGHTRGEYLFDQEMGVLVQRKLERDEEQLTMTLAYTDVKINEPIPEDRFTFVPPKDVVIQDKTRIPSGPAPLPARSKKPRTKNAQPTSPPPG